MSATPVVVLSDSSGMGSDAVSPGRPPFQEHARSRGRGFLSRWDRHPAVPAGEELTRGERAADAMRNRMGSWGFVGSFLVFLLVWVVVNSVFWLFGTHGRHGFDPYPYILLNLFLSMLAAIQGAILLIAAKRSDQIASQLAEHDYQTNLQAFERIEAVHQRVTELAESNRDLLEQNREILERIAGPAPGAGPDSAGPPA